MLAHLELNGSSIIPELLGGNDADDLWRWNQSNSNQCTASPTSNKFNHRNKTIRFSN